MMMMTLRSMKYVTGRVEFGFEEEGGRLGVLEVAELGQAHLERRHVGQRFAQQPRRLQPHHPRFVEGKRKEKKRKEKKSGYLGVELGQEEGVDEGQVGSAAGVGDVLGAHALDLCPRFACNSGAAVARVSG
jgi:hypothetical protein